MDSGTLEQMSSWTSGYDWMSIAELSRIWDRIWPYFTQGRTFVILLCIILVIFLVAIVIWFRRRTIQGSPIERRLSLILDSSGGSMEERSKSIDGTSFFDEYQDEHDRDESPGKYRFRKRDKAMFFTKKIIRKVRSIGRNGGGIGRRLKPSVMKFATAWLSKTKERREARPLRPPPASFFEPDDGQDDGGAYPPEIFYVLKNIRIFGHFETPCFLELCRHVTEVTIPAGQYLFKPGDADDSIYVVQRGHLSVYVKDGDQEFLVKAVGAGESVLSLLSILDVLTGHAAPFKTVMAKADVESVILKLSAFAFNDLFDRFQESWIRTIQIIAIRLQRVTFATLHQYLGLSMELTKPTLRESATKRNRQPSGDVAANKPPHRSNSLTSRGLFGFGIFGGGAQKPSEPSIPDVAPSDPMHCGPTSLPPTPEGKPSLPMTSGIMEVIEDATDQASMPPSGRTPVKGTLNQTMSQPIVGQSHHRPVGGSYVGPSTQEFETLKKAAMAQLTEVLGLTDKPELLDGKISVQVYPPGYTLTEQGSENAELIYVLSGGLELTQKSLDDGKPQIAAVVHSHELVGGLAMLTGEPSFYTVKTRLQSRVATISKNAFYDILSIKPRVVLAVAHTVVVRLSTFIRAIDFALDWEMCDAGKALYNQSDPADSLYVVLSGRLRSVQRKSDKDKKLAGEYGRGDLVGLIEVLTSRPRATTVYSVRYSELSKVPSGLLNYIKMKYPQVLTRIIHLMGQSILGQEDKVAPGPYSMTYVADGQTPHVANLNTIAIVAVADDVPLGPFSLELLYALKSMKATRLLSRDVIEREMGGAALLPVNEYRLFSWLSQQEDAYGIVLYQCDYGMTAWSRRCIRQADCVLIVAIGENKPTVGPLEDLLERSGVRAQKNLVLLWNEQTERPSGTQDWLDICGYVSSHYHVRSPHRLFIQARRDPRKVADYYADRYSGKKLDQSTDFARIARMLTGRGIGLVLGGGGARGAAHLGILRALKEYNVPIDFIGGTSIGSFVGGLFASDPDANRTTQKAREWFSESKSRLAYIPQLTWPYSAILSGYGFNRTLQKYLGDRLIEDLWIPYFSITTDITSSQMRVHRNGHLWRYTRSSMSISGVLPPICDPIDGHLLVDGCYVNNLPGSLWRYCRASMSLAGYFPPICDPLENGHQLLDGGYVNNLPADVMRTMGVGEVLAVDVGSEFESNLTDYGDALNGFWVLYNRWIPWGQSLKILSMDEIQNRLAYVSCVRQLEMVKKSPFCSYIRPPIDQYRTLDFALFDEIDHIGYIHGKSMLDGWASSGKLEMVRQGRVECLDDGLNELAVCSTYQSPQTFTDLAALVSKIQPVRRQISGFSDFSDEDESMDEFDHAEEQRAKETSTNTTPKKKSLEEEEEYDRKRTWSMGASSSISKYKQQRQFRDRSSSMSNNQKRPMMRPTIQTPEVSSMLKPSY